MAAQKKRPDYFLKLAKSRKTTYEFSEKKVKLSDVKKILEAARWSPSCENVQPWHFIVIQDKKRISELMKSAAYGGFHSDPPILIALVLKKECWEDDTHRCVKDEKLGIYEAYLCVAMPALSIVFEALELGIDSCFLTPKQSEISGILKVRKNDTLPLVVGLGYEKEGAFQKKRTRGDLKRLVSYEFFGGKL